MYCSYNLFKQAYTVHITMNMYFKHLEVSVVLRYRHAEPFACVAVVLVVCSCVGGWGYDRMVVFRGLLNEPR